MTASTLSFPSLRECNVKEGEPREITLKKLRYKSWHRGSREMDLILGPYADQHLEQMSDDELQAFAQLLEEEDADLWRAEMRGESLLKKA